MTEAHLASAREAVRRQGVGSGDGLPAALGLRAAHEGCQAGAALEQPQGICAAVLLPAVRTNFLRVERSEIGQGQVQSKPGTCTWQSRAGPGHVRGSPGQVQGK